MPLSPGRIFRKTELGLVAVNTRPREVPARARMALILVNGRDSVAELVGKIGDDAAALIETLLAMGLVEDVPAAPATRETPARRAAPVAPPPTAAPPPEPVPDPALAGAALARLAPLKRAAVQRLAPQFGPDVDVICQPLLAAKDDVAFRAALDAIEAKLAIYLGRGGAKRMLDGLWP